MPVSAAKNEGIDELLRVTVDTAKNKRLPTVRDICQRGPVHRCIHSLSHMVEDHAERVGISSRFATIKLLEGDTDFTDRLELSENESARNELGTIKARIPSGFKNWTAFKQ